MAATPLTNQVQVSRAGVRYDNAFVAADNVNGNSFVNDGQTVLLAVGTAGGTLTFKSVAVSDSLLTPPNLVVTLTGTQAQAIGPFNPAVWGSAVTVTASVATITLLPVHVSG